MADLPPFSGHGVQCPKCGADVETIFSQSLEVTDSVAPGDPDPSRILIRNDWNVNFRRCRECRHWWAEAPLDAAKSNPTHPEGAL